jgi:hypothetical protein
VWAGAATVADGPPATGILRVPGDIAERLGPSCRPHHERDTVPNGEETRFTMTITRRIDGHDYVAGKEFASASRGIPGRDARSLGEVALALMDRIDHEDARPQSRARHS